MGDNSQKKQKAPSYGKLRKISSDKTATVHFIGIGGVSMYSLARLTSLNGARVTGSDREESDRTRSLTSAGIYVKKGHSSDNIDGADLVVYTHAISEYNPELNEAERRGIPTVPRAEYLGALMLDYGTRIGVSGSHGKSTTVAMLERIFSLAGKNPTVLSGSDLPHGDPFKMGSEELLIYEACEYRDSFLRFSPTLSLGLNLELDHTDYFADIEQLTESFVKALGRAENFSVINGDDVNLKAVIKRVKCPVVTFGVNEYNDYRYFITNFSEVGFEFSISHHGENIGSFMLNIPGTFNVHNAVAAIVVALECGIDPQMAADAIEGYSGIAGRLEYVGSRFGRAVYYDYAHHPTEIAASLNALRQLSDRPLTVIFKPHTFSRTASLWRRFCSSLSLADYAIITDIYPAREQPIEGITSCRLAEDIGSKAMYCSDSEVDFVVDRFTDGTIVLMGAGNFDIIKSSIIKNA